VGPSRAVSGMICRKTPQVFADAIVEVDTCRVRGFRSRWDYERKAPGQGTSSDLIA
jgi:hypothetical protein